MNLSDYQSLSLSLFAEKFFIVNNHIGRILFQQIKEQGIPEAIKNIKQEQIKLLPSFL